MKLTLEQRMERQEALDACPDMEWDVVPTTAFETYVSPLPGEGQLSLQFPREGENRILENIRLEWMP